MMSVVGKDVLMARFGARTKLASRLTSSDLKAPKERDILNSELVCTGYSAHVTLRIS